MSMTWETIKAIVTWAGAVVGLVTAILGLLGKLPKIWRNFVLPLWKKLLRPSLKVVVAPATLIIPNGLIIGLLMYRVAIYYFEAGSLDFVITNSRVFLSLVGWQTFLVSLYSFMWTVLVFPRVRRWFVSEKSNL
jgi:hypothetical protein